ncbi:partner of Y14 and mago [Biomphalaria pfeifferi]|uniref:Partner of Y14 and mago n=1 Tax=Biomphalaria pfeifferi TaxID=112525 RepID=A0AAD8BMJ3_BIOPF|nr:partner of Y14 and mago [Biomphalaria pfeifferi]
MMAERTGVVRDEQTGELILPATQRPDGTWRKPRRVKDGYIPQEEVPVYETKGTQWAKGKPDYPIGLNPNDIEKLRIAKNKDTGKVPENVLSKAAKKNAKRKEKRKQTQNISSTSSIENSKQRDAPIRTENLEAPSSDVITKDVISKKIKSLKKKLRQIEDLEEKIKSGILKNPEKEQLEKLERKKEILDEIEDLELELDD